ncbi:hypothetical protein ACK3TF_003317 [Chlorella vulgaris]
MGLRTPLAYLTSGVVVNIVSQLITDTRFSSPNAHIIPAVKFLATLLGAALRRPAGGQSSATPAQRRLMAFIGLLDASAYCLYCLGFYACGATLANLLLAAVGQVLTAALTRFVLKRRLTPGQLAGVGCVGIGLLVRALPASYFDGGAAAADSSSSSSSSSLSPEQLWGAACVAMAALLYAILGVAYEKLLKGGESPPPANAEIMWHVSILGFLGSAAYQALFTLPNWQRVVAAPMAASNASPRYVAGLLVLFGALFNVHMLVQAAVFKTDGAIGVGLVNAVRGAVITVVAAAIFCSPSRQQLCLTRQTVLSACITTCGGAIYVLTGGGQRQQRPAAAAARAAQKERKKDQ